MSKRNNGKRYSEDFRKMATTKYNIVKNILTLYKSNSLPPSIA